jgi:WD40 repeat protein
MPNPYNINDFSPSLRDYLLNKNIVADTITNNGLLADLIGIGSPVQTETLPIAVSPSPDIVDDGLFYKDQNVLNNQFLGGPTDYTLIDIQYLNNNITSQTGPYSNNNDLLNTPFIDNNGNSVTSTDIRQQTTVKNIYVDTDKQLTINLNTTPVPTYQNLTSYIDENNNLSIGGPSTQAADIIGSVLNGQGVGFDFNNGSIGVVANEDIRATLLGRVLGATGAINDTPLGIIGGQQLLSHVGYNSAFGLQQETLGALNLNPLTLLQGDPFVTMNYSITVPKGSIGKVLNFTANILGVQSPISLLEETSSIFTFGNKLNYIGMSNIERANEMIKNSGKGQVFTLFNNLRANTNVSNPYGTTLRQGYAPGYSDDRVNKGELNKDGINPNIYARTDGNGLVIDFLMGEANSPITSGNYERSKQVSDDGWDRDYYGKTWSSFKGAQYTNAFGWQDSKYNKDKKEGTLGITDDTQTTLFTTSTDGKNRKKTLLSKTEQLFNSGNMRTLISGHGIKEDGKTQTNSSISSVGNYTSKGSGVMSSNAVKNGTDNGPENVFCRTWTTYDRYAQVLDLQKNKGVNGNYGEINGKSIYRNNAEASVMDSKSNGFVKVAPYRENDVKKYMFSIENLAWAGDLTNLLPCEVGPGDPNNAELKGRIMWFPPYDMSFSETTSANWEKHNFIGRGEPMYTYNNTERTGSLSWKIIIDHPNYLNLIKDNKNFNTNDYLASFFAGCMPLENVPLTPAESDKSKIENATTLDVKTITPGTPPPKFNVYFPNDVYTLDGEYTNYEDGKCKDPGPLSAKWTLSGHTLGVFYSEFSQDGTKVVTASGDEKAKIWDVSTGNLLFTLNGHIDTVITAKFSSDGTKVVTASFDNTAKIWEVSTGNLLKTLSGHTEALNYAEFNPDNTKVVTASDDYKAKVWDTSTGNLLFTLNGHIDYVMSAKFSPNDDAIVTASFDTTARIWYNNGGAYQSTLFSILSGHTQGLKYAEFNSNSDSVVTASEDGDAKIWDFLGSEVYTLAGHTGIVNIAKFNSNGTKVVTASQDTTAKIWDLTTGYLIKTLAGHTKPVVHAEFSSNGKKVVTASVDKTSKIWSGNDGEILFTLVGHDDAVVYSEFNSTDNKLVTASYDDTAKIWEIPSGETDGVTCYINRDINLSGASEGLDSYREMCYQFKVNGVDTWSSVECSKNVPPGPIGSSTGRLEPDRSDFGLNGTGTTTDYKNVMIGDKKYVGFRDLNYGTDLNEYLREKCPNCKVQVVGYASTVGTFGDDRNDTLAKLRAEWVKDYIQNNILDEEFKDKISVVSEGQGATDETASGNKVKCPTPDPIARRDNYLLSKNDEFGCKAERYVTVKFVDDPTNSPLADEKQNEIQNNQQRRLNIPVSRLLTECDYFERLEEDDKVVYDAISEKIKYFQPAFHSTTPEGFNARLTFLQQCMRQGKTKGVIDNSNPSNLAFGRPPVCILRIGDFYHTKIVIDNISLDYEPLVWDLNPEGVGVQPMICNVTMSFAFIGGSSLNGPISKLQNAVSFNYYANTEMYDSRSDYNQKQGAGGETKDGNQNANPTSVSNTNPASNDLAGGNPNKTLDTDQVAQNENEIKKDNPVSEDADKKVKYPGFDNKTGIYTVQNAQNLTEKSLDEGEISDKVVIPRGAKIYYNPSNTKLNGEESLNISQGKNPYQYEMDGLNRVSLANKIYYNKINYLCSDPNFLYVDDTLAYLNANEKDKDFNYAYQSNNGSLEKILNDIFCKAGKLKTPEEIKNFDNTI